MGRQSILPIDDDEYLEYEFASAWSPPVAWLKAISQRFPSLVFRLKFDEPSNGFMGVAQVHDGDVDEKVLEYF
jgi:hypothetical protein